MRDQLLEMLLTPEVRAAIMAIIIAVLRIAYDGREARWQRIGLEAMLCGAIAYGLSSGLNYFELSSGVSVFAGSTIGFLGVDFVRAKARQIINKKSGEL